MCFTNLHAFEHGRAVVQDRSRRVERERSVGLDLGRRKASLEIPLDSEHVVRWCLTKDEHVGRWEDSWCRVARDFE